MRPVLTALLTASTRFLTVGCFIDRSSTGTVEGGVSPDTGTFDGGTLDGRALDGGSRDGATGCGANTAWTCTDDVRSRCFSRSVSGTEARRCRASPRAPSSRRARCASSKS